MSDDIDKITDFDNFFYHGTGNLDDEIKSDLMITMLQPKKSLYYSRNDNSAGIKEYENQPQSVNLDIGLRYDIVSAIGKRNLNVSRDTPNRQVAASQSQIVITRSGDTVDISILYLPLKDFRKPDSLTIPLGG
jgi:hypothetical protein